MIPEKVEEKIREVMSYAETDDWLTVKKEIVRSLPWKYRTLFSRRHPITKEQQLNDFELEVIKRWEELSGRGLYI
jgi:hypothetical protein